MKFGKSRSNAQRELKKVLSDEQFVSAKKWFKQLGKSKSYTAALHELWGDAHVADDDDHTDVSELVLERPTELHEAVEKLHRVDEQPVANLQSNDLRSSSAGHRTDEASRQDELRVPESSSAGRQEKPFDIIASLKRTIDAMDANKPLTIYEKLSRIVEK